MRRRRFLMIVTGSGALAAIGWQTGTHLNYFETPANGEIVLRAETIVGPCVLPADVYLVACDCSIVTFCLQSTRERMVELPCRGVRLKSVARETSGVFEPQPSGRVALEKLYIKGSNVEHVF